ncbi:MAG: CDGSH iron-sulfur domain-containing protein, partial [Nanoarchaeota archaeon]
MKKGKITVSENGPYLVLGNFPLEKEIFVCGSDGIPIKWKKGEKYYYKNNCMLCRCGHSENKPFCDGTHALIKFDGKETAND